MNRSRLRSPPFLALYVAAFGAVLLQLRRHRWGSASWYPIAVGFVAACAILSLRHMLTTALLATTAHDRGRILFFSLCALLPASGVPYFLRDDTLLALALLAISCLFAWAALGTLLQWPGFRHPPLPNQCPRCRYDLTGNTSGTCPECGEPVNLPD